jgi:hypothetical protein
VISMEYKKKHCKHKKITICERSDGKLINVCDDCNYERVLSKEEQEYWRNFANEEQCTFVKYPLQK